jgi:hypothetical protein
MRIKFENPCPDGTPEGTTFLNKSKLKFTTKSGDSIVSPYEGKVTKTGSDSVEITHKIGGDKWVSTLDGFYPTVTHSQIVHQGRQIGRTKNGKFTFDISPNVNVEDLISGGVNSSTMIGKSSEEENGPNKYKSTDDPLKGLLKVFLSPVTFAQGALNLDEQEIQEKTTLIKEEINRMKKLF